MMDKFEEKLKEVSPMKHLNRATGGFIYRLKDFLKEYGVLGIAIGVIFAQASKDLIDNIVKDALMPLLGLILPTNEWGQMAFTIKNSQVNIGNIISSFLTWALIVILLYIIVKRIIKAKKEEVQK